MLFFTSDTHFGHARINELARRPFSSVEEMNETLIERYNSVVGNNDTVIHLGDVALGQISESLPLLSRLKGTKILVPGNHDRIFSGNSQKMIDRFSLVYSEYFEIVYPEILSYTLSDGTAVTLSHFPYSGDSTETERYSENRPQDFGGILLHGHVHEAWRINGRQFNVGVDVNDFTPVSEAEILHVIHHEMER